MTSERELRREIARQVQRQAATIVKFAPYTLSSSSGETDKIEGYSTDGSDEEKYDIEGRRVGPFGLRSRPPKGVDAVWLAISGGASNGVIVGAESSRFGPSDLDDGEVGLYCKATDCLIKLDKDGKITITASAGQVVEINGNTYSMLKTDTLLSDLKNWVTAVNATVAGNCVNGAPLSTYSANSTALAAFATSIGAAGAYKSTKAKNG